MASLREIRDHIGSVRSTLKITSAMKLVASAKLRKAQQAAEALRDYSDALGAMLTPVLASGSGSLAGGSGFPRAGVGPLDASSGFGSAFPCAGAGIGHSFTPPSPSAFSTAGAGAGSPQFCLQKGADLLTDCQNRDVCSQKGPVLLTDSPNCDVRSQKGAVLRTDSSTGRAGSCASDTLVAAVVAIASNSSLCGAFNINAVRKVLEIVSELKKEGFAVEVIAVGRKMSEAMRRSGFPQAADWSQLVGHASFDKTAELAQQLLDAYAAGQCSRVVLVYNHFVSTGSQKAVAEHWLPFEGGMPPGEALLPDEYILEPSAAEILPTLLPQVMRLRLHTAILDSLAAEHAARTVAMQAASDNAEDLLGELTLEYNKGRQQKITAEILDLVGGAQR